MVTLNIDPFGDTQLTPEQKLYQQLIDMQEASYNTYLSTGRMIQVLKEYEQFANEQGINNEST